jgi:hypothetical protein
MSTVAFDISHGSPYDRGGADSYYNRERVPHRGGVGLNSGPRIEMSSMSSVDIDAYHAGYDDNERDGSKKI